MADGKIQQVMMQNPVQVTIIYNFNPENKRPFSETAPNFYGSKRSALRNSVSRAETRDATADRHCSSKFQIRRNAETYPPAKSSREFEFRSASDLCHQQPEQF